jgi:hypothetical protein
MQKGSAMGTTVIGRIGAVSVMLGVGAALAATPWAAGVAAASPNEMHANANSDNPRQTDHEQNLAISTNGVVHVQKGTATAFSSGHGSTAIADGYNAAASANGDGNHAHADGFSATAVAGELPNQPSSGVNNRVFVKGDNSSGTAVGGNANTINVNGDGNSVFVQGGGNDVDVRGGANVLSVTGDANTFKVCSSGVNQSITGNGQKTTIGKCGR